jgi:predicted DNA repair protein MutK
LTPTWVITGLMVAGGLFLCYEGCEKLAHKFLHPKEAAHHREEFKVPDITLKQKLGFGILTTAPYLMKFLSIAGTAAMFLVGGGILVHSIPPLHHLAELLLQSSTEGADGGGILVALLGTLFNGAIGLVGGAIVLAVVTATGRILGGRPRAA